MLREYEKALSPRAVTLSGDTVGLPPESRALRSKQVHSGCEQHQGKQRGQDTHRGADPGFSGVQMLRSDEKGEELTEWKTARRARQA